MSQVKQLLQRCYDALHSANFTLGEVSDGLDAVFREKIDRREMMRRAKRTLEGQARLLEDLETVLDRTTTLTEGTFDDTLGTNAAHDAGASPNGAERAPGQHQRDGS